MNQAKPVLPKSILKPWRMLLIYNIYRLFSILVLFAVYWLASSKQTNMVSYFSALVGYFTLGCFFFYLWSIQFPKVEQQVLISGTIDIIAVVLFIHVIGYINSGLGVLLYAYIAVLSILAPGQMAIYFASLASFMLLALSIMEYLFGVEYKLGGIFTAGVYGTGFFATALTAWYLAKLTKSSEELAKYRAKELASLQRLNAYIVERLQYGVIFVDDEFQIKVINSAARHFLNAESLSTDTELKALSQPLYHKCEQFLSKRTETEQSAQTTLENPDLKVYFLSSEFAEKMAVLIILNEMTEIAQQAQQLKLAALGRFSASIAHELRNPLGAISHAIQLLGEDKDLSAENMRLKQLILNNCERMDNVIKNVLQLSRRPKIQPEIIHLNHFLKHFKAEFCLIHQCKMILKFPKGKDITVFFDKTHLEQILVILCDNALQHGKDTSGNVTIIISVAAGDAPILTFCDHGPGIPPDLRLTIFEPFFTTLVTGNGMGLFIAKDLCEINQARLDLIAHEHGCFSIQFNDGQGIRL